jgi:type I restriction enzyme S subunit
MNLPALRFSEFSANSRIKALRDVSLLITKGTTPKTFTEKGVHFIKIESFKNNRIDISKCSFISEETHSKDLKRSILEEDDILFAIAGATIGKCEVVTKDVLPANTNQALAIIRLDGTEHSKFIYHVLRSPKMQKYIIDNISVGAQPNLNLEQIGNFSLSLPEYSEQSKIADFITNIDEKISQLTQKYELLNKYKKGVMQQIFSQELRFKHDDGSEFSEWSKFTIGEVLIKNSSKNKNLEFNLVQSVSNKHGFINQDELFEDRVIASKDLSNYYIIKKHAFAYNPSRIDVGSLAYKRDNKVSVVSPLYVSFYAKSNFIFDEYLINWFDTSEFKKQMTNSFEGGVRNTLSYDSLSKMTISLPNLKEQTKIANFLTAIDEKITSAQSQLELVKQYKQGLLQQMFV